MDRLAKREYRGLALPEFETRATSQAATGNVQYYSPYQTAIPVWGDTEAIEEGYQSNIYVHACVNRIARDICSLPFKAGPDPSTPDKTSPGALITRFLGPTPKSPNPEMSARTLWAYSLVQYLVTGRFAWLLERQNGRVVAIWPLMSRYLVPILSDNGRYFDHFRYGIPGTTAFESTLSRDDVVYVYRPAAHDVKQAESPLQAARIDVNVAKMMDQFEYNFYKNNAVPSHLIATPAFSDPESRRAYQEQWRADFGGPRNAGKAMFLEMGSDEYGDSPISIKDQVVVEQIGTNAEDAQTSAARDSHIQDICVAFGVPLSILGDTTHSKFQNADMDERNYWRHTILSLTQEIADQINTHLAPQLGNDYGWFDTSGVAALNPNNTIKPVDPLPHVMANLITRDEARGFYGLPPWAEVDPEDRPVIVPAGLPGVVGTAGLPVDEPASEAPVPPTRLALVEARHAGHEHLPIPGGHLTPNTPSKDRVKAWEVLLTDSLKHLLGDQRSQVLGRLNGRKGKRDLYDAAYWTAQTRNRLEPIFRSMELMGAPELDAESVSSDLVEDIRASLELLTVSIRDSDALQGEISTLFEGRAEKVSASILGPLRPTHVDLGTATQLFTDLSTGNLDLAAAMAALDGAA